MALHGDKAADPCRPELDKLRDASSLTFLSRVGINRIGVGSASLRHAPTLAARFGGQCSVLGETTRLWSNAPTALSPSLGSKLPVLGEASLFVRHVGAALAGDFPLLRAVHAGEPAWCSAFLVHTFSDHDILLGANTRSCSTAKAASGSTNLGR